MTLSEVILVWQLFNFPNRFVLGKIIIPKVILTKPNQKITSGIIILPNTNLFGKLNNYQTKITSDKVILCVGRHMPPVPKTILGIRSLFSVKVYFDPMSSRPRWQQISQMSGAGLAVVGEEQGCHRSCYSITLKMMVNSSLLIICRQINGTLAWQGS